MCVCADVVSTGYTFVQLRRAEDGKEVVGPVEALYDQRRGEFDGLIASLEVSVRGR
jgi:hypothetical protein